MEEPVAPYIEGGAGLAATAKGKAAYPPGKKSWECEGRGRPYRKPTPVGWENTPQVHGRTLVKELGNLTP